METNNPHPSSPPNKKLPVMLKYLALLFSHVSANFERKYEGLSTVASDNNGNSNPPAGYSDGFFIIKPIEKHHYSVFNSTTRFSPY